LGKNRSIWFSNRCISCTLYKGLTQFYHPNKIKQYTSINELKRVFNYRKGFSHLCIKHNLYLKLLNRILSVLVYIFILFFIDRKKIKYYFSELLGILTGIIIR
jgi:hypothetical protein